MNNLKNKKIWLLKQFNRIKKLYPKVIKVYGPYLHKKENRHIVILYDGIKRTGKQYAKIKMELKLNTLLGKDDTVDHKDKNTLNDRYYNLEIITRSDHAKLDRDRLVYDAEACCLECNTKFTLSKYQVRDRNTNKAGPFCSKRCTGIYGTKVQKGLKYKRTKLKVVKTSNKEIQR